MTATKADLHAGLMALENRLLRELREQTKWFAVMLVGQAAAVVAVVKVLP